MTQTIHRVLPGLMRRGLGIERARQEKTRMEPRACAAQDADTKEDSKFSDGSENAIRLLSNNIFMLKHNEGKSLQSSEGP